MSNEVNLTNARPGMWADYHGPLTRIDDIDSYLREECCGQA